MSSGERIIGPIGVSNKLYVGTKLRLLEIANGTFIKGMLEMIMNPRITF